MTDSSNSLNNSLLGVYIHIPFCFVKCSYCNFCSIVDLTKVKDYFSALNRELRIYANKNYHVDTVYFGGGTPSAVHCDYLDEVLGTVRESFSLAPDCEITIEINPGSVSSARLKQYYFMGINRLSIGMQSLDKQILNFLGRTHTIEDSLGAFFEAREIGFNNIGIDLIYGVPGQMFSKWSKTLEKIVSINPEHLSCYLLTFELGTLIGDKFLSNGINVIDDFNASTMFLFTEKFLSKSGYYRYEISNFSKRLKNQNRAYISRHNSKYWNFLNYIGFGLSAHSLVSTVRWWNETSIDKYICKLLDCKDLPIAGKEELTIEEQMNEFIYLGLRQFSGIDTNLFARKFGIDFFKLFEKSIEIMLGMRLIQLVNNNIKLTDTGFLFLDNVASYF